MQYIGVKKNERNKRYKSNWQFTLRLYAQIINEKVLNDASKMNPLLVQSVLKHTITATATGTTTTINITTFWQGYKNVNFAYLYIYVRCAKCVFAHGF